jgi:hypothetical protein
MNYGRAFDDHVPQPPFYRDAEPEFSSHHGCEVKSWSESDLVKCEGCLRFHCADHMKRFVGLPFCSECAICMKMVQPEFTDAHQCLRPAFALYEGDLLCEHHAAMVILPSHCRVCNEQIGAWSLYAALTMEQIICKKCSWAQAFGAERKSPGSEVPLAETRACRKS